jgi:hypothetical protein
VRTPRVVGLDVSSARRASLAHRVLGAQIDILVSVSRNGVQYGSVNGQGIDSFRCGKRPVKENDARRVASQGAPRIALAPQSFGKSNEMNKFGIQADGRSGSDHYF